MKPAVTSADTLSARWATHAGNGSRTTSRTTSGLFDLAGAGYQGAKSGI